MRQRVEDLGRLAVMIDNMLDLEFWDTIANSSPEDTISDLLKDIPTLDLELEELYKFVAGAIYLREKIYECLEIAKGQDYLNEPER